MYKITYLETGNIFELPDKIAEELKQKYPADYKILSKNGRRFADKIPAKNSKNNESIYSKVIDNDNDKITKSQSKRKKNKNKIQ
ncbi:hypothetical protein IJO12_08800 [bacterium]|nr:hypothetical protein [bacterium]